MYIILIHEYFLLIVFLQIQNLKKKERIITFNFKIFIKNIFNIYFNLLGCIVLFLKLIKFKEKINST
jgi:hypothetical protein